MENKIAIILGSSASGKDTTARILEKDHGFNFIVSTTTRPIRPGESERDPYNFITNDEFKKLIDNNELIEYREYHTLVDNKPDVWYYGAEKCEVDNNNKYVVVLDTVGLIEFKHQFPERVISFYLECDEEIRKQRCLSRGDFNEPEWDRRVKDDKLRFSKEIIDKEVNFVIESIDKEKTVIEILKHLY